MKTNASSLLAGLILSAASSLLAGPPMQNPAVLAREQMSRTLKPGERIVYVCAQCPAGSAAEMAACKEGGRVTCGACRESTRIVFTGMPKAPSVRREAVYTNGSGRDCFFIPKIIAAR